MEQDGASVYGRHSDSGYTSEPSRSLGHSQAPLDDSYDLQRRPRGATRRTRSSLNAVADQLTEQLVETADALVNPAGQPARTRGTSRGVKSSVIQPVPRRSERGTTPPSLDGAAPFERESRPLPAHSSGPSRVRSVTATSTMPDWSEDDDASGNDDMDEAPVRLTQIVSPRTGKTRTIVRKPTVELPTTTSVSTSVGDLQLPSFMLSNQSTKARQQQTYSPPPEWLATALSGNTHPNQSAPTRPATLDSFPVSRPAQLNSANGPLGSLIDDDDDNNNHKNNNFAHYDAVGSSPSFRHGTFRMMAPEPAQLCDRSPPSPLPFSLPGHMPHQHASSSPGLTPMSRFTPPTIVTPLYEAQMLRAPPHAYAFAAEEGVFSPFSPLPSRNDQWRAQQTSGHLFLDDSFSGGDDDRHVHNDPKLSNWNGPERARLDEGQPSASRDWQQVRCPSIDYPRSGNETVPTVLAGGQWPALPPQNMQDSMPRQSLLVHSRETPPPNLQQMVQELARARRVAKLEEAAAEVVGPMSPLLFVRSLDHQLAPLAAPLAAAAEEEDRFSPLPPPPRRFPPPPSASEEEEEDSSANGAALTYERRHFQTPEPRLPSFFSSFATQPHHNAAEAVPKSRPSSTSSYLTESGVPLTVNFRSEGEDVRAHGDDSFVVHEPADEDSADIEDSDADRTAVEPSAKPASPIRNDLPFTIYEDSD